MQISFRSFVERWVLPDDTVLTLRPVLPGDAALLADMLERQSPASMRNRFHGNVRGLTRERLAEWTNVDYRQHFAAVVTAARAGRDTRLIVDARYFAEGDATTVEFGVLVDESWRRRGLGTRALGALSRAAASAGYERLRGSVLAGNDPMLAFVQRHNFCCKPDRESHGLIRAEKRVAACQNDSREWRRAPQGAVMVSTQTQPAFAAG